MTTKVKAGVLDISGDVASSLLVAGTVQATTSGTTKDFTSIPSWVKRITIAFSGVSTGSTSALLVQIGDSGGLETSGYTSVANVAITGSVGSIVTASNGFLAVQQMVAAQGVQGIMTLVLLDAATNTWVATSVAANDSTQVHFTAGTKALSATLDRLRITTVSGDTFDAGKVNILYE